MNWKKVLQYSFIVICLAATLYIFLADRATLASLPSVLSKLSLRYLLLAAIIMFVSVLVSAFRTYYILNVNGFKVNYFYGFFVEVLGMYYSYITPFSAGGQPLQIYELKKRLNVPVEIGTSVISQIFLYYHMALTTVSLLIFATCFKFLWHSLPYTFPIICTAVFANMLITLAIVFLAFKPQAIRKIALIILGFLMKLPVLRRRLNGELLNRTIDNYTESMQKIRAHFKKSCLLYFLTLAKVVLFFSIPYCIFAAFGYQTVDYTQMLSCQVIVFLAASYMPTPGAAGASEGLYYLMYTLFFPIPVVLCSMLLWRVITYYAPIIFCGLIVLGEKLLPKPIFRPQIQKN